MGEGGHVTRVNVGKVSSSFSLRTTAFNETLPVQKTRQRASPRARSRLKEDYSDCSPPRKLLTFQEGFYLLVSARSGASPKSPHISK